MRRDRLRPSVSVTVTVDISIAPVYSGNPRKWNYIPLNSENTSKRVFLEDIRVKGGQE